MYTRGQIYIYNILALLYRTNILKDVNSFFDIKKVDRIVPALVYIDEHYSENITLEPISSTIFILKHLYPALYILLWKYCRFIALMKKPAKLKLFGTSILPGVCSLYINMY
jgi:hypothetical protein